MIPIDIQVSRSKVKVKPTLLMLGMGAFVFCKQLYLRMNLGHFVNFSNSYKDIHLLIQGQGLSFKMICLCEGILGFYIEVELIILFLFSSRLQLSILQRTLRRHQSTIAIKFAHAGGAISLAPARRSLPSTNAPRVSIHSSILITIRGAIPLAPRPQVPTINQCPQG